MNCPFWNTCKELQLTRQHQGRSKFGSLLNHLPSRISSRLCYDYIASGIEAQFHNSEGASNMGQLDISAIHFEQKSLELVSVE